MTPPRSGNSEVAEAIGWVVLAYAWMERTVEMAIWTLLGLTHEDGHSVTAHLNTPARLDILESLARRKIPETQRRSRLLGLTKKIRKDLSIRRNKYIHSYIVLGRDGGPMQLHRVSARGNLNIHREDIDTSQIARLALDIAAASKILSDEFVHWPETESTNGDDAP